MNEPEERKFTGWDMASLCVLILDVIGIVMLAAVTVSAKVKFTDLYKVLGAALPPLTAFFLSIPAAVYWMVFAALIIALILKEIFLRNKPLKLVVNLVVTIVGFVYIMVYLAALILPLIPVIGALGTGV